MKDFFLFKVKPKPPKKTISIEELNVDLLCEHTVMLESFYSKSQNPRPSRRKNMVKQIRVKCDFNYLNLPLLAGLRSFSSKPLSSSVGAQLSSCGSAVDSSHLIVSILVLHVLEIT